MNRSISLQPLRADNEAFSLAVYSSTRTDELALLDWDEAQKDAFLRMQFTAQHKYYQNHFPEASYHIIHCDGRAVGRLYVDRRNDEIRIVDIALLPEYRNGGIGTSLLQDILDEGTKARKPVRIHVEKLNPALDWYERLGFCEVGDTGVYLLMEWSPNRVEETPATE